MRHVLKFTSYNTQYQHHIMAMPIAHGSIILEDMHNAHLHMQSHAIIKVMAHISCIAYFNIIKL